LIFEEGLVMMTTKVPILANILVICSIFVIFLLFGCALTSDDPFGGGGGPTGTVKIQLTDASLDLESVESVNIDIERIKVHTTSGGWQTLSTLEQQFDLKEFVDGRSVVLFVEDLPVGHYTQMRLILGTLNWLSMKTDDDDDDENSYTISGDLNLNPSSSRKNRFEMQTPSGKIDIDTLKTQGGSYTYSGPATEIKILPKGRGRTLTINGRQYALSTEERTELVSDTMTVSLHNTKGSGTGHWWIEIDATDATISPDPGIPEDDVKKIDLVVPGEVLEGIKLIDGFDVQGGETKVITLDIDLKQSIFVNDNDEYILNPTITVSFVDIDEKLLFFDDFGYGRYDADIPGWEEREGFERPDKCSVEDGSRLGGRSARIYGEDHLGVNHYYFKKWDISNYDGGRIVFWAKRSAEWSSLDRVFVEVFFGDTWHNVLSIGSWNSTSTFSGYEISLDSEMMNIEFWIRFRNQIEDENQYLDIDNFEIYGFRL
jgi:hypothetical protein